MSLSGFVYRKSSFSFCVLEKIVKSYNLFFLKWSEKNLPVKNIWVLCFLFWNVIYFIQKFFFCLHLQMWKLPEAEIKPMPYQWAEPLQWQCWILNLLKHRKTPWFNFFKVYSDGLFLLMWVLVHFVFYQIDAFHLKLLNLWAYSCS